MYYMSSSVSLISLQQSHYFTFCLFSLLSSLFTLHSLPHQNRPRAQRDPSKPFWDGSTNIPGPVAVTVPVPVRMSHDRSPRGGTVTGAGTGTSNIRVPPSYEEALGGSEGYLNSSRNNDGAGSSAPHDVTDDNRTYSSSNSSSKSTYDGVRTLRDDDTAATAAYTPSMRNIEEMHNQSIERDILKAEKVLKFNELNTEVVISKRVGSTQNENVETDSRRLYSAESERSPDPDLAVLEKNDKYHGFTEIQNRPEGFRKEAQLDVNYLSEVRKGLKDVESTKSVTATRGDDVIYNDYERLRERGIKVNEEMSVEVEQRINEDLNRTQKDKEMERMVAGRDREEEKGQLREHDRERKGAREKEEAKEKEISDKMNREEEKEQLREHDRERKGAREKEEAKEKEMSDRRSREEEKEQLREEDRERNRAREKEEAKEKEISDKRSREEEKVQLREREREITKARAKEEEEEKEKELLEKRSREKEKEMQQEIARIVEMEKEEEEEKANKSGKIATSDMEVQSNTKNSSKAGSGVIEKELKDIAHNNSLKGTVMKTGEMEYVLQGGAKMNILDAKIRQADVKTVQQIEKLQMNEDKSEGSERSEDDEESKKDFSISMRSRGSESFTTSYQSEDQSQDRSKDKDKDKDKDSTQDSNQDGNYSVVENDFDEQIIKEAVMRELKERNLKLGAEKDLKMINGRDLGSENPRYKKEDSKHDDNINYISSEWASMIENDSEDENEDDDVIITKKHQTQESNQGPGINSKHTDKDKDKDERHTNKTDISTNSDARLDQTCSVDNIENENEDKDKDKNEREGIRSNIILEQFDGLNTQELLASSSTAQEKEKVKDNELEKKCEGKSDAEKDQIRKESLLIQEEILKKSADDLAISEARASVILRRKLKLEKDALAAAAAAAATLSSHSQRGNENYKSVTVLSTAPSSSSTNTNSSSRIIAHVTAKDEDEDEEVEELGSNDDDDDDDDVLNESKSVKGVSSYSSVLTELTLFSSFFFFADLFLHLPGIPLNHINTIQCNALYFACLSTSISLFFNVIIS